jgi:hypothetical protein
LVLQAMTWALHDEPRHALHIMSAGLLTQNEAAHAPSHGPAPHAQCARVSHVAAGPPGPSPHAMPPFVKTYEHVPHAGPPPIPPMLLPPQAATTRMAKKLRAAARAAWRFIGAGG